MGASRGRICSGESFEGEMRSGAARELMRSLSPCAGYILNKGKYEELPASNYKPYRGEDARESSRASTEFAQLS